MVRRSASRSANIAVDYCRFSPAGSHDDFCDSFDPPAHPEKLSRSIKLNFMDDTVTSEAPEGIGLLKLPGASSPGEFIANLNRMLARFLRVVELPSSVEELETYGLPEAIASSLRAAGRRLRGDDGAIAIAFLHALSESVLSSHFERGLLRLVLTAWKRHCADPALDFWLAESLAAADTSAWNWANLPMTEAASAPSP